MTQLVVRGLCKDYCSAAERLRVLDDVNLEVSTGQDISIVGPSGCGKSTLLYILGTLDKPTSGEIELDGVQPVALDGKQLAKYRNNNIGFIFQDHHLLPQLSVIENVLLPALAAGKPDDPAVARAKELIENVGLQDRSTHLPSQLSGGEKQRVAVARALLNRPKLLLADEPTGNLDAKNTEKIAELLFDLPRKEEAMLVVVTHSDWVASQASEQMRIDNHHLVSK